MSTEPLYVDNSLLRAFAGCSTEAFVRYYLGFATMEERATLRSGTAFHEALAEWFRGKSKQEALDAFDASYREFAEEHVAGDDRLSYPNLTLILNWWLDNHPLKFFPFIVAPEMVEIGFAYPLTPEGDIVFCGRIDAIVTREGALYVVEHKTTGRISEDWLAAFHLDSQISGYMWAAMQHTSAPVVGCFLNTIESSRVPVSDRKCNEHGMPFSECGPLKHVRAKMVIVTRTPEQLDEWKKTALHLARRYQELIRRFPSLDHIQRVRMQGTFSGRCRFCAFADWCRMGRPLDYAATNFVHEPWQPFERAAMERAHTALKP